MFRLTPGVNEIIYTLGPAYNEFGYKEQLATTSK